MFSPSVVSDCPSDPRSRSVFLFAIFIRYFCFGKNKTAAQMQLFLPPSFCLLNYRRRVGSVGEEWGKEEGRGDCGRLFCHLQNSRFREHPFVRASERERVFRMISAYADQFDCAPSLSCMPRIWGKPLDWACECQIVILFIPCQ